MKAKHLAKSIYYRLMEDEGHALAALTMLTLFAAAVIFGMVLFVKGCQVQAEMRQTDGLPNCWELRRHKELGYPVSMLRDNGRIEAKEGR